MNNEQIANSGSHGVKWGLIIGVIYALLVYLRYYLGANNVLLFSGFTFVGFVVVMILLFYCGYKFRKDNGNWVEMKEAFKAMFIAVLIFEFFFSVMTFLYLKVIDPNFFDKLKTNTENLLIAAKQSQSQIDKTLSDMDKLATQSKEMGVMDFLKSYLFYVGVSGLFALIFAFIIKRKPPVFQEDNFIQS